MRHEWIWLTYILTGRCVERKTNPVFYGRGLNCSNAARYIKSQMRGY